MSKYIVELESPYNTKKYKADNLYKIGYANEPVQGVYFLWKGKKIVYVGQSENIQKRLMSHIHKAEVDSDKFYWDKFSYIKTKRYFERLLLELFYISEVKPLYNKYPEEDIGIYKYLDMQDKLKYWYGTHIQRIR